MKIVIIGAPGAGKSWLAGHLALLKQMKHVEGDKLFWEEGEEVSKEEFRKRVEEATLGDRWVYEGHIGKVEDIVFPRADKIILIEYSDFLSLIHALKREGHNLLFVDKKLMSLKKFYFNLQNYEKLAQNRKRLIKKLTTERSQDLIVWKNYVDSLDYLLKNLS